MKDILVMVPHHSADGRRNKTLESLYLSWKETTSNKSDFLVGMDEEDIKYGDINFDNIILDINKERLNVIQKINYLTSKYVKNYKYVYFVGNDCIFKTKDWENIFLEEANKNKYCIFYGDDGHQHEKLCTHAFISVNIIESLGFMGPKFLRHYYVDNFWMEMGKHLNCLKYFPNIILEHNHPDANKSETDILYKQASNYFYEDQYNFAKYMKNGNFIEDMKRIKIL